MLENMKENGNEDNAIVESESTQATATIKTPSKPAIKASHSRNKGGGIKASVVEVEKNTLSDLCIPNKQSSIFNYFTPETTTPMPKVIHPSTISKYKSHKSKKPTKTQSKQGKVI